MIRVTCPKCQKKLSLDDAMAGGVGVCPGCQAKFRVPKPAAQAAGAARTADPKKPAAPPKEVGIRAVSKPPTAEAKAKPAPPPKDSGIKAAPTYKPQMDDEDSTPYLVVSDPVPPPEPKKKRRKLDDEEIAEIGVDAGYLKHRKKKKRESDSDSAVYILYVLAALFMIWLGLSAMVWFKPQAWFVMYWTGLGIALLGNLWVLVIAFQESPIWGLLCIFVPFAQLVFMIMNYAECWRPFLVGLAGGAIAITGIGIAAYRGHNFVEHEVLSQPPAGLVIHV